MRNTAQWATPSSLALAILRHYAPGEFHDFMRYANEVSLGDVRVLRVVVDVSDCQFGRIRRAAGVVWSDARKHRHFGDDQPQHLDRGFVDCAQHLRRELTRRAIKVLVGETAVDLVRIEVNGPPVIDHRRHYQRARRVRKKIALRMCDPFHSLFPRDTYEALANKIGMELSRFTAWVRSPVLVYGPQAAKLAAFCEVVGCSEKKALRAINASRRRRGLTRLRPRASSTKQTTSRRKGQEKTC